ncbi:alpha/beta fold hydrolase [Lacticaseibacillus parakribbianus]|uniref:alpha/beta fold hydrolase n=1 Tax=Lacticaseibacillus parakribbianus TaxID=2970927 RepID=UPI0021CAF28D|nr:alpha/beta hydrolase [Lacticaseibacillus parakribbianus]
MDITVGTISIHYTKAGQGHPLLLLHGNGEDHTLFDSLVPLLAPHFTVYALDTRGHGQSSSGKLDYRLFAQDVLGFVQALGVEPVILLGFSDGGITGLIAASSEPAAVRRLIVAGANLTPLGVRWAAYWATRVQNWKHRSPLLTLMLEQPHITRQMLNNIQAPTLVMAGQHDVIRPSETARIVREIPQARGITVPGASHSSYIKDGPTLYGLIAPFLQPLAL